LLEVLQGSFVVRQNLRGVPNTEGNHLVRAIRSAIVAVRASIGQTVVRDWRVTATTANTARRSIQCTCISFS
jgi:hypothetical protein